MSQEEMTKEIMNFAYDLLKDDDSNVMFFLHEFAGKKSHYLGKIVELIKDDTKVYDDKEIFKTLYKRYTDSEINKSYWLELLDYHYFKNIKKVGIILAATRTANIYDLVKFGYEEDILGSLYLANNNLDALLPFAAPKYIDPAIKLLNEAGPQIPGSSNKFNLTEFNKLKRWELEFLISSIETSKDELELKKLIKLLLGFDNYTVKYSTENMYYDRDTHTAKTDPGTIIDLNFDIQTADVLRLVVNSEALSEGTRDDAGKALNNILFDKGILDGIYSDVSNPKRFQLIDYLLDLAKDNTKDLLTEGQKSKYELWMNTYKNSQEPASNIDTAKSFKERVAAYLKSSNIDWSKDLKDSIMLELVESVIKKYDKLGADAIDVLLNGDKDDLSVAEYLSKKAKEGDAYAQYRVGILELVLTNNLDKMKLTYASKYKAFTEEADKYVVKVDSNDERLDKLEKARKSVIDGRFEFVR